MEVLKWVLIVLAAGFIGQFGKRLADHLIARSRRRKAAAQEGTDSPQSDSNGHEGATGGSTPPPAGPLPTRDTDLLPSSDKAAAKIAKKAAKAEIKRAKKSADQ